MIKIIVNQQNSVKYNVSSLQSIKMFSQKSSIFFRQLQ